MWQNGGNELDIQSRRAVAESKELEKEPGEGVFHAFVVLYYLI